MEEASSKFNIAVVREAFVLADPKQVATIQKLLKPYNFISLRDGKDFANHRDSQHFVIAACDFTDTKQMQAVAKLFGEMNPLIAHRVILAVAPEQISAEHLLFSQEIGARYVACGMTRNDDLRNYIKRVCLEAHQVGPLENYEADLAQACRSGDHEQVKLMIERLRSLPSMTEDVCRLLAMAHIQINDNKRAEYYLKQLLRLNDQNLWAANTLGRLYIKTGRVAEGCEVLRKISHFHNLNAERLLTLGDAYVKAGFHSEAQQAYTQGDELGGGQDGRFKQGLAKVKLAENDYDGALSLLGEKELSRDIISFLNMRAILAIRQEKIQESFGYYQQAIRGTSKDIDIKAKLLFNMGLAYVRAGDLEKAESTFEESIKVGGPSFKRAAGPLTVVKKIKEAKKRSEGTPSTAQTMDMMNETEWETLF